MNMEKTMAYFRNKCNSECEVEKLSGAISQIWEGVRAGTCDLEEARYAFVRINPKLFLNFIDAPSAEMLSLNPEWNPDAFWRNGHKRPDSINYDNLLPMDGSGLSYKEVSESEYEALSLSDKLNGAHKILGGEVDGLIYSFRWVCEGETHREDGPALVSTGRVEHWFRRGVRHRVDGPAVTHFRGNKFYCLNGIEYSKEEWFSKLTQEQLAIALANPENF